MTENKRDIALMPVWNSPVGPGPYPMERAEMMIIECEADIDELSRITPQFCEPSGHNRIKIFFANNSQPPTSMGFYEVGLIQEVKYQGELVQTIPYIWVSDDLALLGGRELFGMSKLLMDDNGLQTYANQVFGRLSRGGVTMAEGSMVLDHIAGPDEAPYAGLPSVFERHIQNPNPEKPSLRQLIKIQISDREVIGNLWVGRGHFEMHHPLNSGLGKLKMSPTERAWYGVFKWNLPYGDIVEEREV